DFTRANRLAFSRGRSHRADADPCLDHNLLYCIGGGELGVPNCERNLSAGNPRTGDSDFLRDWNACGRSWGTTPIRMDYRHRLEYSIVRGIYRGRGADDFR